MADNKNIQKIFSLGDLRKKQLVNEIPERTRESYREYGYFGGGFVSPNVLTTISRIDYSNDTATASIRGPLASGRYSHAATSNNSFGYFGGAATSTFNRINYSNDNVTASARGNLTLARRYLSGAAGNSNFGYYAGGFIPSGIPTHFISYADRIDYSNDLARTVIKGPLTTPRVDHSATGNSNFGYFIGGRTFAPAPANYSIVERLSYSNDNVTCSLRGNLSTILYNTTATGNFNFGYVAGGLNPSIISTISRINYSNDLASVPARTTLSVSRYLNAANGNSNFGYFSGGFTPGPSSVLTSNIDRLDYSNDTVTTSSRGPTSYIIGYHAGTSAGNFGGTPNSSFASNFTFPTVPNAGYFGGGSDGTNNLASIDKVDYANDTATASVRSALSVARYGLSAVGNSNFGYFGGGFPGPTSTIDRIEYSSDAQNAILRGLFTIARHRYSTAGNSNFGYFGGGINPAGFTVYSTIDRIDYSTDTISARGPLSSSRYHLSATGNSNFGYFAGGNPGGLSSINRLEYSNDLSTSLPRTTLSGARILLAATGNSNFGYFGGGSPGPVSTVDRIDYSNDTATASARGPLSLTRNSLAATGNSNFGYFGLGNSPASANFSIVDRINYSNDTAIASVRGPLPVAKSSLAASSPLAYGGAPIYFTNPLPQVFQDQIEFNNANTLELPFKRVLGSYGYLVAGLAPGPTVFSSIERLDYSNDTAITPIRSNTSTTKLYVGGAGNSNFGYVAGGMTSSPGGPLVTTVERIDYSNDSAAVSVRSPVTGVGYRTGFGNNNFGYFASSQGNSTTSRIDYSNDTSVVSRNTVQRVAYYRSATGNANFGYIHEGFNTSVSPDVFSSMVERVDYSNDSSKTSIRGPLSLAKRSTAATGNSNFGYFGGGGSPGAVSTVDRINYLNDTATASVRGPLSLAINSLAATGNSNFGYFGGGSPGPVSTVDRIDYSNDTQTASTRGPLNTGRRALAATTNARNS